MRLQKKLKWLAHIIFKSVQYRMLDMNSLLITGTECLLAELGIGNVQWQSVIVDLAWTVHWLFMYAERMLCGMCVGGCVCVCVMCA